jgi:hypothetical protein
MNTSTSQARNFRLKAGKIAMAIAVASAMGGLGMTPAFGDEHDNRGGDERDHGHDADRGRQDSRDRSHDAYHYAQPVYAPPPDYYRARPSPGISLFFPLDVR